MLQTLRFLVSPVRYSWAARERFGRIFLLRLSIGNHVMVSDTEVIREIFTNKDLLTGPANQPLEPAVGSRSIFLVDGPVHDDRRRILRAPFNPRSMLRYAELISGDVEQSFAGLEPGEVVSIQDHTKATILRILIQIAFGTRDEAWIARFQSSIEWLLGRASAAAAFVRPLQFDGGPLTPGHWFKRVIARIDRDIHEIIQRRRREGELCEDDFLGTLMAARASSGEPLSDEEIRDQLLTIVMAAFDSTSSAIAWAFHWILASPEVTRNLIDEMGPLGPRPDPEKLCALPYLDAACREALRVYPVVDFLARQTPSELELGGVTVPAGYFVAPHTLLVHQDPDVYPSPLSFRPERFLEKKFGANEYFPFGSGSRHCLGAPLGLLYIKTTIAAALLGHEIRSVDSDKVRPIRRNVTISPSNGTRVAYVGRRLPSSRF